MVVCSPKFIQDKTLCPCYNCYTHMLCTCKCLYGCYESHGNSEEINNVQQNFCNVYLFVIMHVAIIANGDGDIHLLICLIGLNINNTFHNILDDSPQACNIYNYFPWISFYSTSFLYSIQEIYNF